MVKAKFLALTLALLFTIGSALVVYRLMDWREGKIQALRTPVTTLFQTAGQITDDRSRILLFGDSRIAEWQYPWPDEYHVINRGVPGSTSFQALERLDRDALDHRPDWVVIQLGVNDIIASRMLVGKDRERVISDAFMNLQKIIRTLNSKNIKVVLISVVPDINTDWLRYLVWQGRLSPEVDRLNNKLKSLKHEALYFFDASMVFHDGQQWRVEMTRDALHWNQAGYRELTEKILALIEH